MLFPPRIDLQLLLNSTVKHSNRLQLLFSSELYPMRLGMVHVGVENAMIYARHFHYLINKYSWIVEMSSKIVLISPVRGRLREGL